MMFKSVSDVDAETVVRCEKSLHVLLLDLSLRPDNEQVGSGGGGNEEQFMAIMQAENNLDSSIENVEVKLDELFWSPTFLKSSIVELRKVLNGKAMPGKFKELKDVMSLYGDATSEVEKIWAGKIVDLSVFNRMNQLHIISCLFVKMRDDLDATGITPGIINLGKFLQDVSAEFILMPMRQFIGLERLVRHNFDEDEAFQKITRKVDIELDQLRRSLKTDGKFKIDGT